MTNAWGNRSMTEVNIMSYSEKDFHYTKRLNRN